MSSEASVFNLQRKMKRLANKTNNVFQNLELHLADQANRPDQTR